MHDSNENHFNKLIQALLSHNPFHICFLLILPPPRPPDPTKLEQNCQALWTVKIKCVLVVAIVGMQRKDTFIVATGTYILFAPRLTIDYAFQGLGKPSLFLLHGLGIEGSMFIAGANSYQISLESILIGHEDWVYSVDWQPPPKDTVESNTYYQPQSIISASMDRTMMIWQPKNTSCIWMVVGTNGELNHCAFDLYGGHWSPNRDSIFPIVMVDLSIFAKMLVLTLKQLQPQ